MKADRSSPNPTRPSVRPFFLNTKFIIGLLIAGVVYAYGWRVTEIDPSALLRDAHLVKPLVTALLQPEVFVQSESSEIQEAPFRLEEDLEFGFGSAPPPAPTENLPLSLTPSAGAIGDSIAVHGERLRVGSTGQLFWINSVNQEYPLGEVKTDSKGSFDTIITVPPTARGEAQKVRLVLAWPSGTWKLSNTMVLTAEKIIETIFLGLMATTLAVLVAAPLSFFGARNLMTGSGARVVYYTVRFFFNITRSIEPLIMAILFAVWVGIGPFAGVLALAVHSIAALGKLFSEQIESIDPGPVEAITATGARPLQVILYGILPQILPQFLALTFYRWDINIRMSTIIGFVGGGGIGFLLQQWINLLQYHQAATALWSIALVVIALDLISARIREKITTV